MLSKERTLWTILGNKFGSVETVWGGETKGATFNMIPPVYFEILPFHNPPFSYAILFIKSAVELGYNVLNWTEYFVSLWASVFLT